jgi:serine/threonine protein kinase
MARTKQTQREANKHHHHQQQRRRRTFPHPFDKKIDLGHRTLNGFTIGKKLGVGAFGAVYEGRRHSDGKKCALKFVDLTDEETKETFVREFRLAKKLSTDYGVGPKVLEYWKMPKRHHRLAVLITDLWSISLDGYLKEHGKKRPSQFVMSKVEEQVKRMHESGYVHMDLHSHNILLNVDNRGNVVDAVLTDFGKSLHYRDVTDERLEDVIEYYDLSSESNPKKIDWQMVELVRDGEI